MSRRQQIRTQILPGASRWVLTHGEDGPTLGLRTPPHQNVIVRVLRGGVGGVAFLRARESESEMVVMISS